MSTTDNLSRTSSVYDDIKSAILSMDLVPGEALPERSLEVRFNCSRSPLRVALARLEKDGLVKRSGRSYVVAPIDVKELEYAFDLRELLECQAVRLACQRVDDGSLSRLREWTAGSADLRKETEYRTRMGEGFHMEIARIAGNPFLTRALADVMSVVYRARWFMIARGATPDHRFDEHAKIVELLTANKPDEAVEVMIPHLRKSRDAILESIEFASRLLRGQGLKVAGK